MIPAHFDLNDSLDQLEHTVHDFDCYNFDFDATPVDFDAAGFLNHSPEDAQ